MGCRRVVAMGCSRVGGLLPWGCRRPVAMGL